MKKQSECKQVPLMRAIVFETFQMLEFSSPDALIRVMTCHYHQQHDAITIIIIIVIVFIVDRDIAENGS